MIQQACPWNLSPRTLSPREHGDRVRADWRLE